MLPRVLETLAVAVVGGYLFSLANLPVPWMLGPIAGVMIWQSVTKRKMHMYALPHKASLTILGYMIGASFTLEIGKEIVKQLPAMFTATAILVTCSFFIGLFIAKKSGISLDSAVLGTVPGGLAQMVAMAEERKEADLATVTMMQAIRVLSIFFTVPFVAFYVFTRVEGDIVLPGSEKAWSWESAVLFLGVVLGSFWVAKRLKFPTPYYLGPVLGVILAVLAGLEPPKLDRFWIDLAQVIMGARLGASMNIAGNRTLRRLLPLSIAGSLLTVLLCIPLTFLIEAWYNLPLNSAYLSMAPGGMSEMAVIALFIGADVAVVSAYQLFRLLFILILVPPVITWILNRLAGRRGADHTASAAKMGERAASGSE